jgi:hypothetical protein
MISKKFTDRSDVEKTIKENPLWKKLNNADLREHLKHWFATDLRLSDDAKKYIRQRLKELDEKSKL